MSTQSGLNETLISSISDPIFPPYFSLHAALMWSLHFYLTRRDHQQSFFLLSLCCLFPTSQFALCLSFLTFSYHCVTQLPVYGALPVLFLCAQIPSMTYFVLACGFVFALKYDQKALAFLALALPLLPFHVYTLYSLSFIPLWCGVNWMPNEFVFNYVSDDFHLTFRDRLICDVLPWLFPRVYFSYLLFCFGVTFVFFRYFHYVNRVSPGDLRRVVLELRVFYRIVVFPQRTLVSFAPTALDPLVTFDDLVHERFPRVFSDHGFPQ